MSATFTQYIVNCPMCGKYETSGYYIDDVIPTKCELDPTHVVDATMFTVCQEYSNFSKNSDKGTQYTKQFQRMHVNRNGITDFEPIIIEPDAGKILEINQIDVIWHEDLISASKVIWEIQVGNPSFDPSLPVSLTNDTHIAIAQFYYEDFADLWGGAHKRPISDGPTREMNHIFADRNANENRTPFVLYSSMGMRIYSYSTDDTRHLPGEGTEYNTVNGTKYYIRYNENTLVDGEHYSPTKAAHYPVGYDLTTIKESDDCYTFNCLGSVFPEV